MLVEKKNNKSVRKVLILVSAFSPRFNHIPSVRISKLAKFLSRYFKVYVIGGLPQGVPINNEIDVGTAQIIDIAGVSFNKSNLSGSAQKDTKRSVRLRIKIFLGPLIMFFFPLSSGGGIYYNPRDYKAEINEIICRYGSDEVVVITSYNPWFIIKIGRYFKRKYNNIFWINDYRDLPFDNIVEPVTKFRLFRIASKYYTDTSDQTICVTKEIQSHFKSVAKNPSKVFYYPNGYDLDDLPVQVRNNMKPLVGKLVITYTGRFYQNGTRELSPFLAGLAHASANEGFDFVFKYAGSQGEYVKQTFSDYGLSDNLELLGMVSRKDAIRLQESSDMLLLISYTGDDDARGDGIVTGKFFEYALSKKPIMVLGTSGWELQKVLLNDDKNALIRYSETHLISEHLAHLFKAKMSGDPLIVQYDTSELDSFNHSKLAEKLAANLVCLA
ncbi:hypothetical protein OAE20_03110 [Porticoccaceae bacterium]|nr:hypothetical protein [Porticoccaceae bacterium]